MKFIKYALLSLLLTGCATFDGEVITDFNDRSVLYGWLNIDDVDANRLHSVIVYQYQPKIDKPYFHVKVVEFQGGYLYYSFAFPNGAFGLYSAEGQFCKLLCSNKVYSYEFGKQGDDYAKARVTEPGLYNLGNFRLVEVDTGLFEQGKFEILPETNNAPSNYDMLKEMLKDAENKPAIKARLEAAIRAHEI